MGLFMTSEHCWEFFFSVPVPPRCCCRCWRVDVVVAGVIGDGSVGVCVGVVVVEDDVAEHATGQQYSYILVKTKIRHTSAKAKSRREPKIRAPHPRLTTGSIPPICRYRRSTAVAEGRTECSSTTINII